MERRVQPKFYMRIGKHRRITLPKQLLAAFEAQVGDVLVLDITTNTFFFKRQENENSHLTETWEEGQVVSESERMLGLPGKKQYKSDIHRIRQMVADYFAGLGVPSETLRTELAKLETRDDSKQDQTIRQSKTQKNGD